MSNLSKQEKLDSKQKLPKFALPDVNKMTKWTLNPRKKLKKDTWETTMLNIGTHLNALIKLLFSTQTNMLNSLICIY